jgi:Ser/Thr protein kinase RdoA (MazF antagonist)
MKDFEELTWRGKARRLRQVTLDALLEYNLEVGDVALLGMFTNVMFRVRTADGKSYVLRICPPGWRTTTDLQAEITWLLALARDTDIGAPVPQVTRRGEYLITIQGEGIPQASRCMLMSWIPGTPLGKHLNEPNLFKMGKLFARLHAYSAGFTPPPGFSQRKMNQVFAREEEVVLFGDACRDAFTPVSKAVFEQAWIRVEEAYAKLYADPDGLRVIHHDLWHDNIKIFRGKLYPLDFEDTVWGYPVQDLAMAIHDLMDDVTPNVFEHFQEALRRGYESLSDWPEQYPGQIDVFRAGRMFWVANWVARFQRQYLVKHIEQVTPVLERFLETGRVRKDSSGNKT